MSFTFSFAVNTETVASMGSTHSYTSKIVPITVGKNCIKYAENVLKSVDSSAKIVPNTGLFIGENLHKLEEKEPGARLRAISNAYYMTLFSGTWK